MYLNMGDDSGKLHRARSSVLKLLKTPNKVSVVPEDALIVNNQHVTAQSRTLLVIVVLLTI